MEQLQAGQYEIRILKPFYRPSRARITVFETKRDDELQVFTIVPNDAVELEVNPLSLEVSGDQGTTAPFAISFDGPTAEDENLFWSVAETKGGEWFEIEPTQGRGAGELVIHHLANDDAPRDGEFIVRAEGAANEEVTVRLQQGRNGCGAAAGNGGGLSGRWGDGLVLVLSGLGLTICERRRPRSLSTKTLHD